MTTYPEPPAVGGEIDTLAGSLERQRATFAWKCASLTTAQLAQQLAPSTLTLGRLLKHLAYMEDLNFTWDLAGRELPIPWAGRDPSTRSTWVFDSADADDAATLYGVWSDAVERSRAALAQTIGEQGDGGTTYVSASGHEATVRRLLVDMIEEYGRHTGHADLLREAIDGRTGEDPPGSPMDFHLRA